MQNKTEQILELESILGFELKPKKEIFWIEKIILCK